ncbi:hypothetical protein ONZ43_g4973 [Nemania bipapillata]|uniref:Uncharacterized protein n=1 Tax=Nemania bipapillata TaxID=110536 RepID=A0ACC2IG72_9PEZI|nr:hypothetical protein ONZ43_g4973 [Nemania bipapillata]
MALGNDDNPDNGPQNPFAYVLIPVIGFGLVVSLLTCYRYRRRKQRLAQFATDPAQLEAGRARLNRGPNGVVIVTTGSGGSSGGRRTGRSRRLGLGVGVGSREEGLNELGEAPPAYTPNGPKPPTEAAGDSIELTTYSQATAEIGMSRSPPSYGEEPSSTAITGSEVTSRAGGDASTAEQTTGDATGDTTPAAATTTTSTTATTTPSGTTTATVATTEPTTPPRAVLPSSRD